MRKERKSKDLLLDAILLRALEEENKARGKYDAINRAFIDRN